MTEERLRNFVRQIRSGRLGEGAALQKLRRMPFSDLGFAKPDHYRTLRCGLPEVLLCERKRPEQIVRIARELVRREGSLLATRADAKVARTLARIDPRAVFHELARCVTIGRHAPPTLGPVAIVCAGTSDLPVAEEARVTADFLGCRTELVADVGVAGVHRLLKNVERLRRAKVVVVAAGMEGALPSVVAGLVDRPVLGVPTSVGYGASFDGLAALLAMMNSCAAGVTVVNIDNGFGAACAAFLICRA
jgi:NCAIR mutase (PurE)-related protein